MTLNVSLDNIKQMQQKVEFEDNNTPVQRCAAGGGDGDTLQGWESKLKQVDRRMWCLHGAFELCQMNDDITKIGNCPC